MVCKYSCKTWSILLGMILTGSARSIVVKLAYQSGFKAPLTITLLYLLGQSFSLFVYGIQKKWLAKNDYDMLDVAKDGHDHEPIQHDVVQEKSLEMSSYASVGAGNEAVAASVSVEDGGDNGIIPTEQSSCEVQHYPGASVSTVEPTSALTESLDLDDASISSTSRPVSSSLYEIYSSVRASFNDDDEIPNGSNHGLSTQSEQRIQWVHHIPFYARPAIPAIFNLLNSALRWASLVYIDASVAEMLISGLELTLSVVAARIIRKRMVSRSRWSGVIIVAIGIIIIERSANNSKHQQQTSNEDTEDDDTEEDYNTDNNTHSSGDVTIGVILIMIQSILSVLQDLGEEIFMQATDFPATMMLGMEGLYGLGIGLIIYATIANSFGIEDIDDTISMLIHNAKVRWWVLGLPFLFLVTGIFNIKATEVTSAMTRNVWKNLRTVLVWIIALCIFYLGDNSGLYGEAWHDPESFYILLGFVVMTSGIVAYYWYKAQEQ